MAEGTFSLAQSEIAMVWYCGRAIHRVSLGTCKTINFVLVSLLAEHLEGTQKEGMNSDTQFWCSFGTC
jgi:hypothetical protein